MNRQRESIVFVKKKDRVLESCHSDPMLGRIITHPPESTGRFQVFFGSLSPGGQSSGVASHAGEEVALVLRGRVEYIVNDVTYQLEEGDLIYYPSSLPHSYRNFSEELAEILWVEIGTED